MTSINTQMESLMVMMPTTERSRVKKIIKLMRSITMVPPMLATNQETLLHGTEPTFLAILTLLKLVLWFRQTDMSARSILIASQMLITPTTKDSSGRKIHSASLLTTTVTPTEVMALSCLQSGVQ